MRLDYSDKMKAVRESTERPARPVQKNRPRKEPIGTFALVGLLLLVIGYGAGVLTGWFLFKVKQDPKAVAAAQAASQAKPQAAPAAAQAAAPAQPGQPGQPQPGQPAPEVPLTFYKTLPSGGKGAMGSGINTKLPEVQSKAATAAPAAAPPAPAKPAAAAAPAAKPGEAKPVEKPPAEKAADKPASEKVSDKPAAEKQASEPRYLVQVASYKDKKEAEAVRSRLSAKGIAAYTVESKLQDKGVWYRIRVGRHLSKQEAQQLAGKVGSGATVIAE